MTVSDGRYDNGAATTTYTSPDLVEEVRVIVAPADAETGRGSGQIQMVDAIRNQPVSRKPLLDEPQLGADANTWFNNFNRRREGLQQRQSVWRTSRRTDRPEQDIFLLPV